MRKENRRWEGEEVGARRKKRGGEMRKWEQKRKKDREKRGGCGRLGMPGKRSAASSALLLDKLRETVAWINPPLSLFTEMSSISSLAL